MLSISSTGLKIAPSGIRPSRFTVAPAVPAAATARNSGSKRLAVSLCGSSDIVAPLIIAAGDVGRAGLLGIEGVGHGLGHPHQVGPRDRRDPHEGLGQVAA